MSVTDFPSRRPEEWFRVEPLRIGYRPVYNSVRKGAHMAIAQYARSNRIPSFARRSMFGVSTSVPP